MGAVYSHPPVELPEDHRLTRALFDAAGWTNLALALEPGALSLQEWVAQPEGQRALGTPLSLWVGNEFEGLSTSDRAVCQQALVIPMAEGNDSLNAAVAAGTRVRPGSAGGGGHAALRQQGDRPM